MPHSDEEREKLMEKGEFPRDPNDHSGEPLHMHAGGDDAGDDVEDNRTQGRKESVAQEGGNPHGEPKKGDGTKYIK
jgi:hypothetical protein